MIVLRFPGLVFGLEFLSSSADNELDFGCKFRLFSDSGKTAKCCPVCDSKLLMVSSCASFAASSASLASSSGTARKDSTAIFV